MKSFSITKWDKFKRKPLLALYAVVLSIYRNASYTQSKRNSSLLAFLLLSKCWLVWPQCFSNHPRCCAAQTRHIFSFTEKISEIGHSFLKVLILKLRNRKQILMSWKNLIKDSADHADRTERNQLCDKWVTAGNWGLNWSDTEVCLSEVWGGYRGSMYMLICVCGFEDLVWLLLLTQVVNPAVSPELSHLCDFFAVVWREKVNHLTDSGSHQPWVSQFWCCWNALGCVHPLWCSGCIRFEHPWKTVSRKVAQWRMWGQGSVVDLHHQLCTNVLSNICLL